MRKRNIASLQRNEDLDWNNKSVLDQDEKRIQKLWQNIISLPSLHLQITQSKRFLINTALFQFTLIGCFLSHFQSKSFWGRKSLIEKEAKNEYGGIARNFQSHFQEVWIWANSSNKDTPYDLLILGKTLQQYYPTQFNVFWLSVQSLSCHQSWTDKRIQKAISQTCLDPKELRHRYECTLFDLSLRSNLRWIRREGPRYLFMEWFAEEWKAKNFIFYQLTPHTESAKKRISKPKFMHLPLSSWTFEYHNKEKFFCLQPLPKEVYLRYVSNQKEFCLSILEEGFELCLSNQPNQFTFPCDIVQQYLVFCRSFCHQLQLRYRLLDFSCLWNIIEMAFPQIHHLFLQFPDRKQEDLQK